MEGGVKMEETKKEDKVKGRGMKLNPGGGRAKDLTEADLLK